MKRINYKSDFDFILRLRDCRGEEIGWPDYDWEARFWTSTKANSFIAGCTDGVAKNCYNDGGKIHIVADNHHLGRGTLHVEFTAKLPNDLYPDADERIVVPVDLDIQLISTAAPCPESFEVELMLPYVKISWKDLTPEQIAELKQPAVDAANETREVIKEARAATTEAITATNNAIEATRKANSAAGDASTATREVLEANRTIGEAETVRAANETQRVESEQTRVDNEAIRVSAEEHRATAETERANAESTRISDESARKEAETVRVDSENIRVFHEVNRKESERQRDKAERLRVSAEDGRVEAEMGRVTAEEVRVSAEQKRATEFAGFEKTIEEKQDKLDTTEDLSLEDSVLSLTDRAKQRLFDDLFAQAAGPYGKVDHTHVELDGVERHYYLNELWLTYEEAMEIYQISMPNSSGQRISDYRFSGVEVRTLLPIAYPTKNISISAMFMFSDQSRIEVVRFVQPLRIEDAKYFAFHANALKHVYGVIDASQTKNPTCVQNMLDFTPKLVSFRLKGLKYRFGLNNAANIDLTSLVYLIAEAINTEPITITVHPDVYSKLTDPDNEEWYPLLAQAAEKNIAFATTE